MAEKEKEEAPESQGSSTDDEETNGEGVGARGERSGTRYPYYNLEEAEKFAKAVQEVGGKEVLEDDLLKHLGVSRTTKSWIYKLSTAREFALIERKGQKAGARISITDLGKRLLLPGDENELAASRMAAFLTPPLYQKLFDHYKGAQVHTKFLAAYLVREHKLVESVTEQAATAFTESAKFAGLVNASNILEEPKKAAARVEDDRGHAAEKVGPEKHSDVPKDFIVHPFLLRKDTELMVHLPLPRDLTKKDVKRLVKLLQAHVIDDDDEGGDGEKGGSA